MVGSSIVGDGFAVLGGAYASLPQAATPEPASTDVVDSLGGLLMLSIAIGVIAALLISVSRPRELTVTIEQALVVPAVICSVGAAVLHLWLVPDLFLAWPPAGLIGFLLAAFQLEWAFAFSRAGLRRSVLKAGFVVNGLATAAWIWTHTVGPVVGPTAGIPDSGTGADLGAFVLQVVLLLMLGLAIWPGAKRLMDRRVTGTRAVEVRSLAASLVGVLTFLALAGLGHGHA